MKKYFPLLFFSILIIFFFRSFLFQSLLPIPSDTIVGLYNPYRDLYAAASPRGVPFKNFLITDPVRQQIPWRKLVVESEKIFQLPLWNSYNFSGTPLLANFQSGVFYPLNIFYFFLPFTFAWSFLIFLQPLLAGVFLYLYLKNLKLHSLAAFLGAIVFAFSGFNTSWLEWGVIGHTLMWLPLIMLSVDKIIKASSSDIIFNFSSKSGSTSGGQFSIFNFEFNRKTIIWFVILLFSLCSSFFAGHLQIFFYLLMLSLVYTAIRCWQFKPKTPTFLLLASGYCLFVFITIIQWFPTLQFISLSDRIGDRNYLNIEGWFIPWQHLIQFVAPDFFGNPTTLNYFGVWNYGELVGYIGIFPLLMAFFAIINRRDKKTIFFSAIIFISFLFALPTPIASIPFMLHIPFLSTAQPTRLLSIIDFSMSILAALGFDLFIKRQKKFWVANIIVGLAIFLLWVLPLHISTQNLEVVRHNLYLPTILYLILFITTSIYAIFYNRFSRKIIMSIFILLLIITSFDLLRFADKFSPFTKSSYFFPNTKAITFLQNNLGEFRYMTTDDRILPPNFSAMYNLSSVDGYDPLYIKTYGQLIAASERGNPDIHEPFGFNRIITPHNIHSPVINLLGVKYVLSLSDISRENMKKVSQEGETRIYENTSVLPRAFFVNKLIYASSKQDEINFIFSQSENLQKVAVINENVSKTNLSEGDVRIKNYSANKISIITSNKKTGFLVLTDTYYPTWHVAIDGKDSQILKTDFAFRGVFVPAGEHIITFYDTLF